MKRALAKQLSDDIPPTQPVPPNSEEVEGFEDDEVDDPEMGYDEPDAPDMPEQPDLAWYLSNWEMTNLAKIAICRTYANYLSAQIPKGEGPRVTHKKKIKK